jgi:hypothetical protein
MSQGKSSALKKSFGSIEVGSIEVSCLKRY